VINRGNAGEDIFHSIRDREKFLEYIEKAVERFSIIVHTKHLSRYIHLNPVRAKIVTNQSEFLWSIYPVIKPKVSLETILQAVSNEFGCSKEIMREKGRKNNKFRGIAVYLARDMSGATCCKLGNCFGGVSGAAITKRYNKVAEQLAGDKKLKRKVDMIKNRIFNI